MGKTAFFFLMSLHLVWSTYSLKNLKFNKFLITIFASKRLLTPVNQDLNEITVGHYTFKSSRQSHANEDIAVSEKNVIDLYDIDSAWGTGRP